MDLKERLKRIRRSLSDLTKEVDGLLSDIEDGAPDKSASEDTFKPFDQMKDIASWWQIKKEVKDVHRG